MQLQQHLQLHHHQQRVLDNAAAATAAYSNSPASPLASPTGNINFNGDQQQQQLQSLDAALQRKSVMEDIHGMLETAVNGSRGRKDLAALNTPQRNFFKDGWHMVGMHNFFGDQPKSPTETPPEMEETTMSPSDDDRLGGEPRSEMKNLATLCSAAAAAAAVAAANKEQDEISTDLESDGGEGEGDAGGDVEENTLPPEPLELAAALREGGIIVEEEEADEDEDDTNSGDVEKLNYDDDDVEGDNDGEFGLGLDDARESYKSILSDGDVDYIDDDEGAGDGEEEEEEEEDEEEDDEDDDEFFLDVPVASDQAAASSNNNINNNSKRGSLPLKQRKMATRLENLILTSQSLCDFPPDLTNSELVHVLPQISNLKAAASSNAALNSVLHQQLAAATAAAAHAKAAAAAHQKHQQQEGDQPCGKMEDVQNLIGN